MSDIFKEVDDALKQEKMAVFWQKNAKLIIGSVIALILCAAIFSAGNAWITHRAETKTNIILDYLNKPHDFDTDRFKQLGADQQSVALFLTAKNALDKNEMEQAFSAFKEITDTAAANNDLRGLAAYYARNMLINDDIAGDLESIDTPNSAMWAPFYELQNALVQGAQDKNYTAAIQTLDTIINSDKTPALAEQAKRLKYVYEYDMNNTGK